MGSEQRDSGESAARGAGGLEARAVEGSKPVAEMFLPIHTEHGCSSLARMRRSIHLECYVPCDSAVLCFEGDGGVYIFQRILGLAMVCL
jgi:hypothetical protein